MDVLVDCNDNVNSEAILQTLEGQVKQILPFLDEDVAREYRQAVATVPALVQRESCVRDFLRTEDFHALRAARRLALYWKVRKEIYGQDRWLLPMSQTGSGTLSPTQVELLRSGVLAPATSSRQEQGFVLMANRFRLPPGASFVCPELFFYIMSVATCEQAQTKGVILFHVIDPPPDDDERVHRTPLPKPTPEILQKLAASLPCRIQNIIVARSYDPGIPEQMLETMGAQLARLAQMNQGTPAEFVIRDSLRSSLRALEERGLDRACIPFKLGGDYFYSQHFNEWIRSRLSLEQAMSSAPPIRNTELAVTAIAKSPPTTATVSHRTPDTTTTTRGSVLVVPRPGELRQDFVKRRNNVYVRRHVEKKQSERDTLQSQVEQLKSCNALLCQDNRRLESLLVQARLIVACHLSGRNGETKPSPDEFNQTRF